VSSGRVLAFRSISVVIATLLAGLGAVFVPGSTRNAFLICSWASVALLGFGVSVS
jgi:hypothetical protein